jgi:hypothetical protein
VTSMLTRCLCARGLRWLQPRAGRDGPDRQVASRWVCATSLDSLLLSPQPGNVHATLEQSCIKLQLAVHSLITTAAGGGMTKG